MNDFSDTSIDAISAELKEMNEIAAKNAKKRKRKSTTRMNWKSKNDELEKIDDILAKVKKIVQDWLKSENFCDALCATTENHHNFHYACFILNLCGYKVNTPQFVVDTSVSKLERTQWEGMNSASGGMSNLQVTVMRKLKEKL